MFLVSAISSSVSCGLPFFRFLDLLMALVDLEFLDLEGFLDLEEFLDLRGAMFLEKAIKHSNHTMNMYLLTKETLLSNASKISNYLSAILN